MLNNGAALQFVDVLLRRDRSFLLDVFKNCNENIRIRISEMEDFLPNDDREIQFIRNNSYVLQEIYQKPESFLDLETKYFEYRSFIDVAVALVKNSIVNDIKKHDEIRDDYSYFVGHLLNLIQNKYKRETQLLQKNKKIELSPEVKRVQLISQVEEFSAGR